MNINCPTSSIACRRHRRGVALVAVIVLFAISVTLFGLWAKAGVREHQRSASRQFRAQTLQLAEAGVRRAMARRAADPQYREETWSVPADELGDTHAAEVRIRVMPTEDATAVRYEATAAFPVGAARRVQLTKRIEIPSPPSRDEP